MTKANQLALLLGLAATLALSSSTGTAAARAGEIVTSNNNHYDPQESLLRRRFLNEGNNRKTDDEDENEKALRKKKREERKKKKKMKEEVKLKRAKQEKDRSKEIAGKSFKSPDEGAPIGKIPLKPPLIKPIDEEKKPEELADVSSDDKNSHAASFNEILSDQIGDVPNDIEQASSAPTFAPSVIINLVNPIPVGASVTPTDSPSEKPTGRLVTSNPTIFSVRFPTGSPFGSPTGNAVDMTTSTPTYNPTVSEQSLSPTTTPTMAPTQFTTANPTNSPTYLQVLTSAPTAIPTKLLTLDPTLSPSESLVVNPTLPPSVISTLTPSDKPTEGPTLVTYCPPAYNVTDESYDAGDRIEAGGHVFECRPFPYSPYCSQSEFQQLKITTSDYAEEHDMWLHAWKRVGPCYTTDVPTTSPSISPSSAPSIAPTKKRTDFPTANPTPISHCPPMYNVSDTSYDVGDRIEAGGYIFECQSYPHSLYCGQSEFQPLTIDEGDDEVEKELWLNAWTRVGPCYRTGTPTTSPVQMPSHNPSTNPSSSPTLNPTATPTQDPTSSPTRNPSKSPSLEPTVGPTAKPTLTPTDDPTPSPTFVPSHSPTRDPTKSPTYEPTLTPTRAPSPPPTQTPSFSPSRDPTKSPSHNPTLNPTEHPTISPTSSRHPSGVPSALPTSSFAPYYIHSAVPSVPPTTPPTVEPTASPTPLSYCPDPYDITNTSYDAGDKIEVNGHIFQCRSYPHSLYCGQNEFNPINESSEDDAEEKELWMTAWERIGACYRTESPTFSPMSSPSTSPSSFSPTSSPMSSRIAHPTHFPSLSPSNSTNESEQQQIRPKNETILQSPTLSPTFKRNDSPKLPLNPIALNIPLTRFMQWSLLNQTEQAYASDNLGYNQDSWNNPGSNSVEEWSFHDLYDSEAEGALGLGLDGEAWDCHVNHYYGYWWSDLAKSGYDVYFSILGWDEDKWDNESSEPETEGMEWDDMSEEQRKAAEQVCFFEALWNGVPIPQWDMSVFSSRNDPTNLPTNDRSESPTKVPTDTPTPGPTKSPSSSLLYQASLGPTGKPTTKPTSKPTSSPTISPSTKSPTQATLVPSGAPTKSVTLEPKSEFPIASAHLTKRTSADPTTSPTLQTLDQGHAQLLQSQNNASVLHLNPIALNIPLTRFMQWSLLNQTEQAYASDNLGYNQDSWNNPGSNSVEEWSFHDLYDSEAEGALGLGLDGEAWDCHVNHYYGYWWSDLAKSGYDVYFSILGWDEDKWDNGSSEPETEGMEWDDMSEEQRKAAEQVCFFEALWNGVPIPQWDMSVFSSRNDPTNLPTNDRSESPTKVPTDTPTPGPTKSPSSSPLYQASLSPTGKPTTKPTSKPSSVPTNASTTSASSSEPTSASSNTATHLTKRFSERPTATPTLQPSEQQNVLLTQTQNGTYFLSALSNETYGLPLNPHAENIPPKRFMEWDMLSDLDRSYAVDKLEYSQTSWNNPGSNSVEEWSFHDLYDSEVEGALGLGLNSEAWDCHINHYYGYWWSELVEEEIDQYYTILGWDEDKWDNGSSPAETEGMEWDDMSAEQREAAKQVCFFKELWNGLPIPQWDV